MQDDGARVTSIIHVKSILRGAHLIGVYGEQFLPRDLAIPTLSLLFKHTMLTSLLITMQTRSPFEIVHLAYLRKKKFFWCLICLNIYLKFLRKS